MKKIWEKIFEFEKGIKNLIRKKIFEIKKEIRKLTKNNA